MKKPTQYDHSKIEKKWQGIWDKKKTYKTLASKSAKEKNLKPFYVLDMFPYPSGVGLHVGHPRGYIGSDVISRAKRMQGFNVLHPMGYDAFGLPAEQYAIEHKIHPRKAVEANVKTFEKQLSIIGLSYDWSRKINTTDPEYYKWTQYIFLELYDHWYDTSVKKARPIVELVKLFVKGGSQAANISFSNNTEVFSAVEWNDFDDLTKQDVLMKYRLAYIGEAEVNWCEKLGTVLANDEIVDSANGPVSERGNHPVEKIRIKQWFLRITAYADRLLEGLEGLKWSDHLKEIQKNWIGRSDGSLISFDVADNENKIEVFTTRADTLFGVTYVVLSPEHNLVKLFLPETKNSSEVSRYIEIASKKTFAERTDISKNKSGVLLDGIFAINPANNEKVQVWVADYVLNDYGTGAVMAVPAHDERDLEFAKKYDLIIREVISNGVLINSSNFSGMICTEASLAITKFVKGEITTKYKMRDAIFARQRYWGEPIPLFRDKNGIIHPVKKLPLTLPDVKSYEPTGLAEGPLAGVKAWTDKGLETNTMPGWAGSSWYFLRYMDPKNKKGIVSEEELKYWKNVDIYVGGAEHATGHLLYSRFWNKFLFDIGIAETDEPFPELHNQGMILGSDNRKMSKRWGNVVNPDDVIRLYGADSFRLFEMFIGPFYSQLPWSTDGIIGSRRFIEKVWKIAQRIIENPAKQTSLPVLKALHKTIKKVDEDIISFNFNTAVSAMMILVNEIEKGENITPSITPSDLKILLQILSPFAPHITEELWSELGEKKSINQSVWPMHDPKLIIDDTANITIQINGKTRGIIEVARDFPQSDTENMAKQHVDVARHLGQREIIKIVNVPNRLINFVVKD